MRSAEKEREVWRNNVEKIEREEKWAVAEECSGFSRFIKMFSAYRVFACGLNHRQFKGKWNIAF